MDKDLGLHGTEYTPFAMKLCAKVYLKVICIMQNIQEATAFITFGNTETEEKDNFKATSVGQYSVVHFTLIFRTHNLDHRSHTHLLKLHSLSFLNDLWFTQDSSTL